MLLASVFIFCINFFGNAQFEVTGNVLDQKNIPLQGANIIVKGSTVGTQTDFDGAFKIVASEGDILTISYI